MRKINHSIVEAIIKQALAEDLGDHGDITSDAVILNGKQATMNFVSRQPLTACGLWVIEKVYAALGSGIDVTIHAEEGKLLEAQAVLAEVSGDAKIILAGERTALNLLTRMCAVASHARQFADAVKHTSAKVLDTRKTMPCLRELDKYACRTGGISNHRYGLYDMVLIKDNHIAVAGSVTEAVRMAANALQAKNSALKIEVEVDNLQQFQEALESAADIVMLDNFSIPDIKAAVELNHSRKKLEASGGVTLDRVREIAETGVDYISAGCITASPPPVDIGLDYTAIV